MLQPGMCSATVSESSTWLGPPGACETHCADSPSSGGADVGATDGGVLRALEGVRQIAQPERIGIGVVVDVGEDLALRLAHAQVAGVAQAPVLALDQPHRELARDRGVASVEPSSTTITS